MFDGLGRVAEFTRQLACGTFDAVPAGASPTMLEPCPTLAGLLFVLKHVPKQQLSGPFLFAGASRGALGQSSLLVIDVPGFRLTRPAL